MTSPIIICGMHRSGTPLVARLLNLCGLYLGEYDEMMPARGDNPRGFWEHILFLMVDKAIINKFGREDKVTNDLPFLMMKNWWKIGNLSDTRLWARTLCHSMEVRAKERNTVWGFKDPRASVLLPFWFDLLPDAKVVICLRHPLDVAASLQARDKEMSTDEAVAIWYTYNRMAMDATTKEKRSLVRYDWFFEVEPLLAVLPVLDFCDLYDVDGKFMWDRSSDWVAREVKLPLRHHYHGKDTSGLPEKVELLFQEMLEEAG